MRSEIAVLRIALGVGWWLGSGSAEIVDRIAVVVDTQAIKQSDILSEIRITDFLNNAQLDLGIGAQKEAASRLIDQKVIRKAMETGLYQAPAKAEVERLLEQVRQRRPGDAAYRRALAAYGITEDMLREHLIWQLAVLRFISLRFQAAAANDAESSPDAVNEQFFAWLDQTRKEARIDFKREDLR